MTVLQFLFLALSPFQVALAFDPSTYDSSYEVPLSNITLHWSVAGSEIRLALRGQSTGYIAMGLAEPTVGGMAGSDILVANVIEGVPSIEDRYAEMKATPSMDGCQDWTLVGGEEADGWTVVEVTRALVTGDDQDREIKVGQTSADFNRIIVAKSDLDTFGYHSAQRWSSVVHFGGFQPPNLDAVKSDCCRFECDIMQGEPANCKQGNAPASGHIRIRLRNNDFAIPTEVTTYEDAVYNLTGVLVNHPNGVHIVGMEAVIQEETKALVHHFTVLSDGRNGPTLWAWVPGNGPYVLPDVAGIKLHRDGTTGPNTLVMQTHFDNAKQLPNMRDSSGIDLYVTSNLRTYDAGMMNMGDGTLALFYEPVGDQRHTFECSSECTSTFTEPLIVINNMFHMHRKGEQMWTTQTRGGVKVDEWRADFYDSAFENVYQRVRTIQPGDVLTTNCIYKPSVVAEGVRFGLASQEEMCIDFIAYYPKQNVPAASQCGLAETCGTKTTTSPGAREPVAFGTSCDNPQTQTTTVPSNVTTTLSFDPVYNILTKYAFGHIGTSSQGGFALGSTDKSAWDAITCVASSTGENYITPSKPQESELVRRVLGCEWSGYDLSDQSCTTPVSKMPPSGPGFSADEVQVLLDWIMDGASFDSNTPAPCASGATTAVPASNTTAADTLSSDARRCSSLALICVVLSLFWK